MPSWRLGRSDEGNVPRCGCAVFDLEPPCLSHGLLHWRFEGISRGACNADSLDLNDHVARRETGVGRRRSRKDLVDLDGAQLWIEDSVGINCQGKPKPALFGGLQGQGRK